MSFAEKLPRRNYSKLTAVMEIPDLLQVQLESFESFLQARTNPRQRHHQGLEAVFRSVFPIESTRGDFILEYLDYSVLDPKYSVDECQERDLSYMVPLKARLRLIVKETDEESG